MFDTPYQTTSLRKTVLNTQSLQRIRTLEINGSLMSVGSRFKVSAIKPGVDALNILPFTLPMTKREVPGLECDVVFDARSLLRANGEPIKKDAWEHAVRVAELTAWWVTTPPEERSSLLSIGSYASTAYMGWITNLLSNALSLSVTDSLLLRATSGVFFGQQFMAGEELSGHDADRIVKRTARGMAKMDSYALTNMLGDIPKVNDLTEWLVWTAQMLNTPKFDRMSPGVMLNMVNNSWGHGYNDQVKVAVEYPPVFNALVYTTLVERGYSKNRIGELLHKIIRSDEGKEFIKSINDILRG